MDSLGIYIHVHSFTRWGHVFHRLHILQQVSWHFQRERRHLQGSSAKAERENLQLRNGSEPIGEAKGLRRSWSESSFAARGRDPSGIKKRDRKSWFCVERARGGGGWGRQDHNTHAIYMTPSCLQPSAGGYLHLDSCKQRRKWMSLDAN